MTRAVRQQCKRASTASFNALQDTLTQEAVGAEGAKKRRRRNNGRGVEGVMNVTWRALDSLAAVCVSEYHYHYCLLLMSEFMGGTINCTHHD